MQYLYETGDKNYADLASGRVLYNRAMAAPFPVRLAGELFCRCRDRLAQKGVHGPISIYDPCCGGGYLLTTLGFLHGECISKILASDIDPHSADLAERNLSLLTTGGIERRIEQIRGLIDEFGKDSHREALESALRLKGTLADKKIDIDISCFCADALNLQKNAGDRQLSADLVITDIPHGNLAKWSEDNETTLKTFLDSLLGVLGPESIVALCAGPRQKISHERYRKVQAFKVGKRQVFVLEPR